MRLSAQRLLTILCIAILPALLVPRGFSMSWCVCELLGGEPEACCEQVTQLPSCCGPSASTVLGSGEDISADAQDCECCHTFELEEGPTFLVEFSVPLPPLVLVGRSSDWTQAARRNAGPVAGASRAPPICVVPAGLLPAVRPMRL